MKTKNIEGLRESWGKLSFYSSIGGKQIYAYPLSQQDKLDEGKIKVSSDSGFPSGNFFDGYARIDKFKEKRVNVYIPNEDCYVATVIYNGDANAPQVQALRRFRDNVLMENPLGRGFVKAYYASIGRNLASLVKRVPGSTPLVRRGLDYIVEKYD